MPSVELDVATINKILLRHLKSASEALQNPLLTAAYEAARATLAEDPANVEVKMGMAFILSVLPDQTYTEAATSELIRNGLNAIAEPPVDESTVDPAHTDTFKHVVLQWNANGPGFDEPLKYVDDDPNGQVDQLATIRVLCRQLLHKTKCKKEAYLAALESLIAALNARTAVTIDGTEFQIDHVAARVWHWSPVQWPPSFLSPRRHREDVGQDDGARKSLDQCTSPCCRAQ